MIPTSMQTISPRLHRCDVGFFQGMLRFPAVCRLLYICKDLFSEALRFLPLMARSEASLTAEILFMGKQLAFYQERKIKPRRFDDAARLLRIAFLERPRADQGSG